MQEETTPSEEDPKPPGAAVRSAAESASPPASVLVRTLLGVILILCVGGLLWLDSLWADGYVLAATGLIVAAAALGEFGRIAARLGIKPVSALLVGGGVALVLAQWAGWAFGDLFPDPWKVSIALLCVAAFGTLAGRAFGGQSEGSAQVAGITVLGLIYIAVPLSLIVAMRMRWGLVALVTMLAVCKITDIGAYYAGTVIGGAKLAPRVSPFKTVAGAIGGIAAATALSAVLSAFDWSIMSPLEGTMYGLVLGPVAVAGDLAESALKRQAGLKDSGALLRGYGGVLDMVDDVLFAAPTSYLFFSLFCGTA